MQRAVSLLIALLVSFSAHSEPLSGASYIGMCSPSFPCDRALKALESSPVKTIGYLSDAFGHSCECVKFFMQSTGKKYIRVHLANGTCFPERGRRCGRYDVFKGETQGSAERKLLQGDRRLLRRFRMRAKRTINLLGLGNPSVTVRYSICLECQISDAARRVLVKEALRYVPKRLLVDSVVDRRCLAGLICEKHGDSMTYAPWQRCISDLDGITMFDADLDRLKRQSKQCEAIYYWSTGFNLLPYGYRGSFIPPYDRRHSTSDSEFDRLEWLLRGPFIPLGR